MSKVLCLRKFKKLFTLNLSGNAVSKCDDYKLFIDAYFPNLTCLDFKMLDEKTVSLNSGVFHINPESNVLCCGQWKGKSIWTVLELVIIGGIIFI